MADGGELDVAGWNAANPLHPRSGDGEFRDRLAGAVRRIADSWGEIVNHEEFGEPDHDFNDHGVMALHDDGWISISRVDVAADQTPDDENSPSGNIANLDNDDALVLQERVEMAVGEVRKLKPGQHSNMDDDDEESPFLVSVTYGVLFDGNAYVALTEVRPDVEGEGESLQLDPDAAADFVEQLGAMREQQYQYERDKDNPYLVRPLPPDETLMRRKKVSSEDNDDVLLGIVDTPRGRRLRFGLGGGDNLPERSFTGGPGPMVADLGPDEAREFDEVIESVLDEMDVAWENQQLAIERLEEWEETPSGERWSELTARWDIYTGGDGQGGARQFVREKVPGVPGHRGSRGEGAEAPPEVYAEVERLQAEQSKIVTSLGLLDDEGDVLDGFEVQTAAGTVVVDIYQWDLGTKPDVQISVRPHGVTADDEKWADTAANYEAYAKMTRAQLKKLRKLVHDAFVDGEGNPITKSARGAASRVDRDRIAREGRKYWTRSAEGLGKWARKAHPWTALYRHLSTKMNPELARRLTSSYFKAVFGYAPSARQGKNPVGKG